MTRRPKGPPGADFSLPALPRPIATGFSHVHHTAMEVEGAVGHGRHGIVLLHVGTNTEAAAPWPGRPTGNADHCGFLFVQQHCHPHAAVTSRLEARRGQRVELTSFRAPYMPLSLTVEQVDGPSDQPGSAVASTELCCERKLHLGSRIGPFAVMGTLGALPPCCQCSRPRPERDDVVGFASPPSLLHGNGHAGYSAGQIDIGRRPSEPVHAQVCSPCGLLM